MDSYDDKRQEMIARVMAACDPDRGSGCGGPGGEPWTLLSRHLCPLIGENGFIALLRRTVRKESARFTWLELMDASTVDDMLAALRTELDAADTAVAVAADNALLHTFTKLLSGLIGEALTVRLLQAAWNGALGKPNAREQS